MELHLVPTRYVEMPRQGALRRESRATSAYTGRSASSTAFPRSTWERGELFCC